ncbi:MAG: hypothetical protein KF770_07270 [Anaerolineae bacterium]|nr:hypothetical protein [Anaerolineae bacterium]
MDVSAHSDDFLQSPYWKVIIGLILIGLVAFVSWFCAGSFAWLMADSGNGIYWYDSYFVYIVSFIVTFAFAFFFFLWIGVRVKFLIPLFIIIGVVPFAIFSSLLNVQRQERLAILERYQSFRDALNLGNWKAAYLLMSPEYREEHTVAEFEKDILLLIDITYLTIPDWVQEINIYAIHPSGAKAWLVPERRVSKDFHPSGGVGWNLVKVDGEWYFEEHPNFFID